MDEKIKKQKHDIEAWPYELDVHNRCQFVSIANKLVRPTVKAVLFLAIFAPFDFFKFRQ